MGGPTRESGRHVEVGELGMDGEEFKTPKKSASFRLVLLTGNVAGVFFSGAGGQVG